MGQKSGELQIGVASWPEPSPCGHDVVTIKSCVAEILAKTYTSEDHADWSYAKAGTDRATNTTVYEHYIV